MTEHFSYIGYACDELLRRGFSDQAVLEALEQVGSGARVDRVYVFERSDDPGRGTTLCSQRYEWSADDVAPQIDNPELQNVDMHDVAPSWIAAFAQDLPVAGLVQDQPLPVRDVLASQAIVSICVCPIRVADDWWGFVGFDDCHGARVWPADEVRALRRLSNALAATLRRHQTAQRMQAVRQQLQMLVRDHPMSEPRPAARRR